MADNVAITAGTGTDIATDQVTGTGEHVQVFKLAISTDGSRTLVPADGTNGLKVDVSNTSLPIGDGTNTVTIDTDPADAEPNSGNALHTESRTYIYNGTTWDRVRGDISNGMDVDVTRVGGNVTVVQSTASNLKADANITNVRVPVGDASNTVAIDTAPADGETNNLNSLYTASREYFFNGTTWDRARGDTTNGLDVDVTRVSGNVTVVQATAANLNATVTGTVTANAGTGSFTVAQATAANLNATVTGTVTANAGTGNFTVTQATAANLNATVNLAQIGGTNTVTAGVNGLLAVGGNIAHDTADSGNPVKIGAKADSSLATVTLVADGDRTDAYADLDGVLVTKPLTTYGDIIVTRVTNTDGASTAFAAFGAVASTRNFISTITVYNSSTTNGFLDLRDGTAGTVIYTIPLPALGGATINFPVPLRQPTANTALAYDVSAALTTVYISAVGFQSKA